MPVVPVKTFLHNIITTANKNRVKHPSNRRLPSKESRLSLSDTQEQICDNTGTNDVDEVFENLLNSDDVCEPNHITDYEKKEGDIPSSDLYVDDFDALLEEDNAGLINIENDVKGDVDADFDALLKEENFEIEANNTHSLLAKESTINDKNAEIKENESVTDMKENILKEKQMNSSMEDIFEKLENNGSSLLEMETLLEKGLLEKSDLFNDAEKYEEEKANKDETKLTKDPFDDLFNELDETSLEDVDKGFQQIYADDNHSNDKDNANASSNVDIIHERQPNQCDDHKEKQKQIDVETGEKILNESLQAISESQVTLKKTMMLIAGAVRNRLVFAGTNKS